MSSCPEKKLLSAYVDNEVLSPWREQIEAHINTCDSCASTVKNYKRLKSLMHNDSLCTESPDYLERSFSRLNNHRTFRRVVEPSPKKFSDVFVQRFAPAMVAAAIFALILPVSISSEDREVHVATVEHLIVPQLPADVGVISDGTLPHAEFASMIGNTAVPQIEVSIQMNSLNEVKADEQHVAIRTYQDRLHFQSMFDGSASMFSNSAQFSYTPSIQY